MELKKIKLKTQLLKNKFVFKLENSQNMLKKLCFLRFLLRRISPVFKTF